MSRLTEDDPQALSNTVQDLSTHFFPYMEVT